MKRNCAACKASRADPRSSKRVKREPENSPEIKQEPEIKPEPEIKQEPFTIQGYFGSTSSNVTHDAFETFKIVSL